MAKAIVEGRDAYSPRDVMLAYSALLLEDLFLLLSAKINEVTPSEKGVTK